MLGMQCPKISSASKWICCSSPDFKSPLKITCVALSALALLGVIILFSHALKGNLQGKQGLYFQKLGRQNLASPIIAVATLFELGICAYALIPLFKKYKTHKLLNIWNKEFKKRDFGILSAKALFVDKNKLYVGIINRAVIDLAESYSVSFLKKSSHTHRITEVIGVEITKQQYDMGISLADLKQQSECFKVFRE